MSSGIQQKKILIIEDDDAVSSFYGAVLRGAGYRRLRFAETGEDAIQIAKEWMPDLIISDIFHPGPNAFEIYSEVSLNPNTLSTRFIIASATHPCSHLEYLKRAHDVGVSFYLIKPISPQCLLQCVAKVFQEVAGEKAKGL